MSGMIKHHHFFRLASCFFEGHVNLFQASPPPPPSPPPRIPTPHPPPHPHPPPISRGVVSEMVVDSEVNRLAACPTSSHLLAVKGSCGTAPKSEKQALFSSCLRRVFVSPPFGFKGNRYFVIFHFGFKGNRSHYWTFCFPRGS